MLNIVPERGLMDTHLRITGSGFKPRSKVSIVVETTDINDCIWYSRAVFKTDKQGALDLAKQAPIRGSYEKSDVTGLLWSMQPKKSSQPKSFFVPPPNESYNITVSAIAKGKTIESHCIERFWLSEGVKEDEVNTPNVKGVCYVPSEPGRHPAILLCGGTEGGIDAQRATASLLASHGYVVFLMAIYNYPGLQRELYEIPLERFQHAVEWLRAHKRVDAKRIAAMAPSRGAEGVLAASAYIGSLELTAIVATSPSNVVWQGLGKGKPKPQSSWSYQGKPLPYLKMNGKKILNQMLLGNFIRRAYLSSLFPELTRTTLHPAYEDVMNDDVSVDEATIPVEDIQAPLLLIAGKDDKVWPSVYMSQAIMNRRKFNLYSNEDKFLTYDGAGHIFQAPFMPSTITWRATPKAKLIVNFGGTPRANAHAQADAWKKILDFLELHLHPQTI